MPRAAILRTLIDPDLMKTRLRTFAMLDAILAPDMRSFEWHPKWAKGQQMGAFKDGEGDFFFAWFCARGAVVRGFDHERRTPPGIFDGLPDALAYANEEPAFALDEVTFCIWQTPRDEDWQCGKVKLPKGDDPDGAKRLLGCFQKNFAKWTAGYYGEKLDGAALSRVWWGREPIDEPTLRALNPDYDRKAVRAEAKLLGWPIAKV